VVGGNGGTVIVSGTLTNNNQYIAQTGTYTIDAGTIAGAGTLIVEGTGDLVLNASTVLPVQNVAFEPNGTLTSGGVLTIGTLAGFTPAGISGFVAGDLIDLPHLAFSAGYTPSFDTTTGDLSILQGSTVEAVLHFPNATNSFHLLADAIGGTEIACYLHGTRILTDAGEVPVEELRIGDRMMTRSGEAKPIKWLGRRSYEGAFAAADPSVAPVLIHAGALADGVPKRDLYVSPEHALYLDRVLIPARHLVNGASIVSTRGIDPIRYVHIELAAHDVIYAEGAAAETFVDCDSRGVFHNEAEFAALYPGDAPPRWQFCAPVLEGGRRLAAIQRRLMARAERLGLGAPQDGPLEGWLDAADRQTISGWARLAAHPLVPARLEVLADERVVGTVLADAYRADLEAAGLDDGQHAFELRLGAPLDPFTAHTITVRRAADGTLLPGAPKHLAAAARLDPNARAALAGLLRQASARAASAQEAEALLGLLLGEAEQARLAQIRLARPAAPPPRRTRTQPRRALVIDEAWPRVDRDAGSQAIVSHMRALQRLGWEIEFAATTPLAGAEAARAALEAAGVACHAAPAAGSVEEVLRRHAGAYRLVYLHRLSVAAGYAALARQHQPQARLLYSVADLHHLRVARQAAVEARPELERQAAVLRGRELLAMRQVDAVLTHSPAEAALLEREAPGASVHVVPWAVRPRPLSPLPWSERSGVVLVANFHHEPNRDGLWWLVREVMPAVWAEAPGITLNVVGADLPVRIAEAVAGLRVRVLGHVPDLAPVLGAARLAVAPLRFGAGIKGKVLEAWAAGLACAMTPVAAEGLPLTQVLAGCVAEDPTDLAGLIVALHADAARNAAVARAGKAALRQQFSQRSVETALAEAVSVEAKDHRREGNVRAALGREDTCPASAAAIVFNTRSAARREGSFCT